ncbi:MAG: Uma2 family endonuclease [Elainellaceae cyanobacterium]
MVTAKEAGTQDAIAPDAVQIESSNPEGVTLPPVDLYSDEPPLETDLHLRQIVLLLTSLEWLWQDRLDFFASGNLTIYFSPKQIKSQDFRGPDFFVVLDTERRTRKSWVVWQEDGKYPNVIVEVLSSSTAKADRGEKKQIYQDTFRTPEYFWFDPDTLEFEGFVLMAGEYESIPRSEGGTLWSRQLGLYLGVHETKLRFFTEAGGLVRTPEEAAREAQQAKEEAQQAKEAAQQRADRLAERLRELGVDPDAV